jgi:hypothetical protein
VSKILVTAVLAAAALSVAGCLQEDASTTNKRMQYSKVYIGALTCDVAENTGYLIGSSKDMDCVFEPLIGGQQAYDGKFNRLGIDVGYTKKMHMMWKVFSIGSNHGSDALIGKYLGENAAITADQQTGGNWLYGGQDGAAVLQATALLDGSDLGYKVEYGVARITLKLRAGQPTVAPAQPAADLAPPGTPGIEADKTAPVPVPADQPKS